MRFARLAAASAAMTMVVGGFAASTSFAQGSPHWMHGSPQYSIDNNAVEASGVIAGVGNQDATINLEAHATVTCVNHGGNTPPPFQSVTTAEETVSAGKNGKLSFTVITAPVDASSCHGNMQPQVTFTSATLTVTIGGEPVLTDVHTF